MRNKKIFKNRVVMNLGKDDFLVVHEGLQNNPDLKEKLFEICKNIRGRANCSAHLSDIGCSLSFLSKDLLAISKECFMRHQAEKDSVKQKPNL